MSTDTKIKTLIFNKLTQEQYNNADKVPTEFYLTPDTSIDSSEKGVANGVASLDTNGKVPTEQIPVATTSTPGGVKPDGTTITVTEDGTISVTGGSGSGEFDYVVETYTDEQGNWYRKYKSGWLEQGGYVPPNSGTSGTITFLKPFIDNHYTVASNTGNSAANNFFNLSAGFKTATSIPWYKSADVIAGDWIACGQGA